MSGKTRAEPLPGSAQEKQPNALLRYLGRFDDGELVRWTFRGLLLGTIGVLVLDLRDLGATNGWIEPEAAVPASVVLPPDVRTEGPVAPGDARPFVPASPEAARDPMRFSLEKDGVLLARGTIDPGAAERFAAELDARGEYVKAVSLDSPGGSLADALAIGRAVREAKLDTRVSAGAQCASSCPLVLAGGVVRSVEEGAAVGVHQVYAAERDLGRAAQAMSDAQATTARISRYLAEMGVDPALWLHALDTPPRGLYRFSAAELSEYRLVTGAPPLGAVLPPS